MKRCFRQRSIKRRLSKLQRTCDETKKEEGSTPHNDALEAAIALTICCNQDPRSLLELVKQLSQAYVLSLASPVGNWDPFDVKPQVFAFGTSVGLPLFSSLSYLRTFAASHGLVVRSPSGQLWANSTVETVPLVHEGSDTTTGAQEPLRKGEKGLSSLMDATTKVRRLPCAPAIALPMFGPLLRSFFVGYYCDFDTFFVNASILSDRIDFILNPSSSLELVMAREIAVTMAGEGFMRSLFSDVERALQSELRLFFSTHCPEVEAARSAVLPLAAPDVTPSNQWPFEVVVLIDGEKYGVEKTIRRLQYAKREGWVTGHSSLLLLHTSASPSHVVGSSRQFYTRVAKGNALKVAGACTIGTRARPESYYHDSTAQYCEGHSVFFDGLKAPYRYYGP